MRASDKTLHDALMQHGLTDLAARAGEGHFNDYFGTLAAPQHALLVELRKLPGTEKLQLRVIAGDFDGTKEEAEEWANSEEGIDTFKELMQRHPE